MHRKSILLWVEILHETNKAYKISTEMLAFLQEHGICHKCGNKVCPFSEHVNCTPMDDKISDLAVQISNENIPAFNLLYKRYRSKINSISQKQARGEAEGQHSKKDVEKLLETQEYHCYYCYQDLILENGRLCMHKDHFVLLYNGGSNFISNIVLSCPECNLLKKTTDGEEFRGNRRRTFPKERRLAILKLQRKVNKSRINF
jgi:5-methylcytosine-specific restriction endonuclease McrA